jgi:Family of unknown function (DUF6069)
MTGEPDVVWKGQAAMNQMPSATHAHAVRAVAVAIAVAAALAVWVAAVPVAGVDLVVLADRPRRIGPAVVVLAVLTAGAAGWTLLAVLEHLFREAAVVWVAIALPVLILSLVVPMSATSVAAMIALAAMHLVVGAVLVIGLALSPPPSSRADRR